MCAYRRTHATQPRPAQPEKSYQGLRSSDEDEDVVVGHSADPHVVVEVVRRQLRFGNATSQSAEGKERKVKTRGEGMRGGYEG